VLQVSTKTPISPTKKIPYLITGVIFIKENDSLNSDVRFLSLFSLVPYLGSLINRRETITGAKLKAFRPKHTSFPKRSKTKPARAGPKSLDKLTMEEFRARAFGRSPISFTMSLTRDCLAGTSNPLMIPNTALKAIMIQTAYSLKKIMDRVRSTACTRETTWVINKTLCRLYLSATIPPNKENNAVGKSVAKTETPNINLDPVREYITQLTAVFCIQVPIREMDCPVKNKRKFRLLKELKVVMFIKTCVRHS
jgi:hypothetical protein